MCKSFNITFSKIGTKGRLGNHMFQIASTIGIAASKNYEYCFPKWNYSKYFKNNLTECSKDKREFLNVKEKYFHFHKWDLPQKDINLDGWLQSEKYFDIKKTKDIFKFNDEYIDNLKTKYKDVFTKKTILIAVRRGDFINHPFYYQVGFTYYIKALFHFFPDYRERNIVFTSDDINYCKKYFSFLKNAFFMEESNDIKEMMLGTLCDDFIISNSTFSWWIAWLGEKQKSLVIRPKQNFRGNYLKNNIDLDFFPNRWTNFDDNKLTLELKLYKYCLKPFFNSIFYDIKYYYRKYFYKFKKYIKTILNIHN